MKRKQQMEKAALRHALSGSLGKMCDLFARWDVDGSGTISKRELYEVLKKAGLANGKQALEVFQGFDEDGDGSLEVDEAHDGFYGGMDDYLAAQLPKHYAAGPAPHESLRVAARRRYAA